jgi:hypothetical protein
MNCAHVKNTVLQQYFNVYSQHLSGNHLQILHESFYYICGHAKE